MPRLFVPLAVLVCVPLFLAAADVKSDAAAAFNQKKYAEAARQFAQVADQLTPQEAAAWAYCRIKLATDRVNAPQCDPAAAAEAERDVTEALRLVPDNAELQKVGRAVIAAAKQKAGGTSSPARSSDPNAVETASFVVRHSGNRELAERVAAAAEAQRKAIFERWSGPPSGSWQPKCEIVLQPTPIPGHAVVKLTDGRATERRVELAADDAGLIPNALPRELTHVVLADLFPDRPPPKWAEEGMAVLAGSPEEVSRFARTLPRCARDGELVPMATLLEMKAFPADKVTGFYCQSVSLVEFLVRQGGERNFTIFLRECPRYGTAQALRRQYNLDGPAALEAAWKRAALDMAGR